MENQDFLNLEFFLTNGFVPSGTKELPLVESLKNSITLDEFLQLDSTERKQCGKTIVCAEPILVMDSGGAITSVDAEGKGVWVASTRRSAAVFSLERDSDNTYQKVVQRAISLNASAPKNGLKNKNNLKSSETTQRKEDELMKTDISTELENQLNTLGGKANGAKATVSEPSDAAVSAADALAHLVVKNEEKNAEEGISPSTSFDVTTGSDDAEKKLRVEQRKADNKKIRNALTAVQDSVKLSNNADLIVFNKKHRGRILGYVTSSEAKVGVSVLTKYKKDAAGHKVLQGADVSVMEAYKNSGYSSASVDKKYLVPEYHLAMKQSSPGSIAGIIFGVPGGILKPFDSFFSGEHLKPDESDTTRVIKALPKDVGITFFRQYFGNTANEDEEIYGADAKKIRLRRTTRMKKDQSFKANDTLICEGRRVLVPGNYIPGKVFLTESLSDIQSKSAQEKSDIIKGFAMNLFKSTASNGPKYDLLEDQYKSWFKQNEDGTYTSDVFDGKVSVTVPTYYNKDTVLQNPQIPVKVISKTKDGKDKVAFVCYNVLHPDQYKDTNPDHYKKVAALNPQTNPAYSKLVNALGDISVEQVITTCCKKPRAKSLTSSVVEVTAAQALAQDYQAAKGALLNTEGVNFSAEGKAIYDRIVVGLD